jgi:uracil-DNA glycosylase
MTKARSTTSCIAHHGVGAIPATIEALIAMADPSWHDVLSAGLKAVAAAQPGYLEMLAAADFLPTEGRLFAAFSQPIDRVRFVLAGEAPYPRPVSATGFCFMDGAVDGLWSATGLSKPVNRATSLRNFMKMLLVADGKLQPAATNGSAISEVAFVAQMEGSSMIQTLPALQANLLANGFLLLNAALVFRPEVPPLKEALAWRPFMNVVLTALNNFSSGKKQDGPTLVLWGKVATQVQILSVSAFFPHAVSEHPYNLSFIQNRPMQELFGAMHLLRSKAHPH